MISLATGAALKAAIAVTAATASAGLLTGTAQAATPGPDTSTAAAAVTQHLSDFPRFDPHRRVFRAHFRTYGECVFFANHDRNPVPTVGTAGGAATGTSRSSTGTDLPGQPRPRPSTTPSRHPLAKFPTR